MPDLKSIDRDTILELIENMPDANPRKIQVWLGNEDTVPTSLGVYEDITDFRINLAHFNKDVQVTFEDYIEQF